MTTAVRKCRKRSAGDVWISRLNIGRIRNARKSDPASNGTMANATEALCLRPRATGSVPSDLQGSHGNEVLVPEHTLAGRREHEIDELAPGGCVGGTLYEGDGVTRQHVIPVRNRDDLELSRKGRSDVRAVDYPRVGLSKLDLCHDGL